jgi:hypothetical protein
MMVVIFHDYNENQRFYFGLWNGIITMRPPGMAFTDSFYGKPKALDRPVLFKSL